MYTAEHKRVVLIGIISRLDNELLTLTHLGNRHARELELAVLRELLRDVLEAEEKEAAFQGRGNAA